MAKRTPKTAPVTRAGKAMRAAQGDLAARREALHAALRKAVSVSVPSQVVEKIDTGEKAAASPKSSRRKPLAAKGIASSVGDRLSERPDLVHPVPPRFTFPPFVEPAAPPVREPGTYPIAELRMGQCRFACTPHGDREHRFCGAATEIGPGNLHGSWCAAHLPHVLSSGGAGWKSRAEVAAKSQGEAA